MQFTPQKYRIPDEPMKPFIDVDEINGILENAVSTPDNVRRVINKSLDRIGYPLRKWRFLLIQLT